jgi:hypothetical protein
MITIRLLISDMTDRVFESDATVTLNKRFAETLTDLTRATMAENMTILRIELPAPAAKIFPRFLFPSLDGSVTVT